MVYSTFMAAVFGMLFAYLIIVENSWLSVIPWIFVYYYDWHRTVF